MRHSKSSLLLRETPPASVNPALSFSQIVRLNEPVKRWQFTLKKPDLIYHIQLIGYAATGVADLKVIASTDYGQDVFWRFTHRKDQNAYTIEPLDDQSVGWTISPNSEGNLAIEIKPIVPTTSDPPQFSPSQLFQVNKVAGG